MSLDAFTLLAVNAANLTALALTLTIIMGRHLSPAARSARYAIVAQMVGWISMLTSVWSGGGWPERFFASFAVASFSTGNWHTFLALEGWLGHRRHARLVLAISIIVPVGYFLVFPNYVVRVGWANFLNALQLLLLARATMHPLTEQTGRWRAVLGFCFATVALLTFARGVLGVFFTDVYPYFKAPHPVNLTYFLIINVFLVVANVSVLVAWREEAELELRRQTMTDPLTTILNRRGWAEQATRVFAHAHRHGFPLALLTIDIDNFKQVNDTLGHEAGDAALRLFGELLRKTQRAGDVTARLGGEEFGVLMPMADETAATNFDRRLRAIVAANAQTQLGHALDFSTGLACLRGEGTLDALIRRSDEALYRAKSHGRGCLDVG